MALGFGASEERRSDSSWGGSGCEVEFGGTKAWPQPKGGGFESFFRKEENEGRTGDEGSGLPLPRPWPCGSGGAPSFFKLLGSLLSTVNWKGEAPRPLPPPPRPLPPPPPGDEVEKAAEIDEDVEGR